jgi:hypothetical protein
MYLYFSSKIVARSDMDIHMDLSTSMRKEVGRRHLIDVRTFLNLYVLYIIMNDKPMLRNTMLRKSNTAANKIVPLHTRPSFIAFMPCVSLSLHHLSIDFLKSLMREQLILILQIRLHKTAHAYLLLCCRQNTSQHVCFSQYVTKIRTECEDKLTLFRNS